MIARLLAATLLTVSTSAAEKPPSEPASLPILYDQPGDRFILRVDSRRYVLPKDVRPLVADLLATANYPRTKLAHEELVAALGELDKALERVETARVAADRDAARSRRLAESVEALGRQLALLRSQQPIDLNAVSALLSQIAAESDSLRRSQQQEDRSQGKAEAADRAAEPARQRADRARKTYADALEDYERPISRIRAIAMTSGAPL